MTRFISLMNIVLALSLLMVGCGSASTPAPWTEEPVAVFTREEAIELLMTEVIQPSPNADMLVAYGLQGPLSAADVLHSFLPADSLSSTELIGPLYSHGEAWFFWIDDRPQFGYAHPTRFVLIDRVTGAVEVTPEEWWPVVNDVPYWDSEEARESSADDIVYKGAHAYEEENPGTSDWSVQFVSSRVTWPLQADRNKYAVLVRGVNGGSPDNSVDAIRDQLIKDGFPGENIKVVKEENPQDTKKKMVEAFDDIVKKIKKDKPDYPEFLFYYVGHGNTGRMVFHKKWANPKEVLHYVPKGGKTNVLNPDGSLRDDSLVSLLLRIPSKDIAVIIDSCKSGTAVAALWDWGFEGRIITATNDTGIIKWSRFGIGCTYFTRDLLEARKTGSFWEALKDVAFEYSEWARYGKIYNPEPQRSKLVGRYKEITISGKVTDEKDGRPIPGAWVAITGISPNGMDKIAGDYFGYTITTSAGDRRIGETIRTNGDGKYKVKLKLIGVFTVEAKAEGYESKKRSAGLDSDHYSFDLSLTRSPPTPTPTITPTPGFSGSVTRTTSDYTLTASPTQFVEPDGGECAIVLTFDQEPFVVDAVLTSLVSPEGFFSLECRKLDNYSWICFIHIDAVEGFYSMDLEVKNWEGVKAKIPLEITVIGRPAETPTPTVTPTSTPTTGPVEELVTYRANLIELMRAANARQKAAGVVHTDWGLGCEPDGGVNCPALDALEGLEDEELPRYVRGLQSAVRDGIPSNRFWNLATNDVFQGSELFNSVFPGYDSWPSPPEEGNLEEIRHVLERLDTVVIEAMFPPATLGKFTPSGLDGKISGDPPAHWAVLEATEPSKSGLPSSAVSRYLENFKRFWHITRAYLSFDTGTLEGSAIDSAFLQVMHSEILAQDRPADSPRKPILQERDPFAIELYSGTWDPEAETGTGYGLGGGAWLFSGEAPRDWENCPVKEGEVTVAHTGPGVPGREEFPVRGTSINTTGWTQFRLKLKDESYPGDPGVPNLRQDTYVLSGHPPDHRLVIRVRFSPLPDMPTSFR